VSQLAAEVQADEALSARIRHKFKIKNTVSLNSLQTVSQAGRQTGQVVWLGGSGGGIFALFLSQGLL
jgi:hypothetical protein